MAKYNGTVILSGMISPTDTTDTYPTHDEALGKGGYRSVQTITERDGIPAARIKTGMLVYVTSTDEVYIRRNGDWEFFAGGSLNALSVKSLDGSYVNNDVSTLTFDTTNLNITSIGVGSLIVSAPNAFKTLTVNSTLLESRLNENLKIISTPSVKVEVDSVTNDIKINTRNYNYQSSIASTTHTISHNLGTFELLVNVYKYNAGWEHFIPKYKFLDINTVEVTLTDAMNIMANIIALNV